MAEIDGLERTLSQLSGFEREAELERVTSKQSRKKSADLETGDHEKGGSKGSSSTGETLAEGPRAGREIQEKNEEEDPDIVWWDGDDDPENPRNWPRWRKQVAIGTASAITFITPLASSMFAPGVPELMEEFESSNAELGSFVVSVFLLGFAFGPLLCAPCSEIWGRRIVFNVTNVGFLVFNIACAKAPSLGALIAFRFFSGCFGSAPLTIGGGVIVDTTPPESRGLAMAFFAMGPLMGPIVGPIAGGFLSAAKGWRWVFWLLSIMSGVTTISTFIFLRETYPQTILERKTTRLRKSTGNLYLHSKLSSTLPMSQIFARALWRPIKMLFCCPIVLGLSIYMAMIYGYLYLLFTTFSVVFETQYGFSTSIVGLSFLGLGVGCFIGLVGLGAVSDRLLIRLTEKHGERKPEFRLPPMMFGSWFVPVGLLWYGWTTEYQVAWIVPIIGTSFVGIGMLATFMPCQTYLLDSQQYAASALAANAVFRSIFGAVLPLCGPRMYDALGYGWGNSLLAFIALALQFMPFLFYYKGDYINKRFPVKFD